MKSVRAIALHNLDNYKEAYSKYKSHHTIYDINSEPLVWLLKISDIGKQPVIGTPSNLGLIIEHITIFVEVRIASITSCRNHQFD